MAYEMDFGEIETVLEGVLDNSVSFEKLLQETMNSGKIFSVESLVKAGATVVLELLKSNGHMIGYLLVLILGAALLGAIANAFQNKQISDMGFYMIFLLLFLIFMKSFGICYEVTEKVLEDLVDFMKVLMPTYLMAVAMSAYQTSAALYYEGFLLLIYYLQKFVKKFLLPAIRCYVLFSLLGYLGKEELFERGRKGLKKLILWAMKAIIGVGAGLQMIQGMISPAIDEMKHTVFSKGVSSLGNIGNVAGNVTDVIIGSGELLKSGIGVTAAVILISICLVPVVKVACYVVFYQVLAIAAEPISDKRLTGAIEQVSEGIGLLVKLLFTVSALFLLTLAIVCVTTGGIK